MISKILRRLNSNSHQSPENAIRNWVNNLQCREKEKGRILLTALRNGTWIEWSVYAAFVFRQMGYTSTLLYQGSEIRSLYPDSGFWRQVSKMPFIQLVDMDESIADPEITSKYSAQIPHFIYDAIAYNHHVEREDIINNSENYSEEIQTLIEDSARAYNTIITLARTNTYQRFVCYSGLIQTTPTLLQAGLDAGIETVCVEGWSWREGHVIYNFNYPALEYNIKGWMRYYGWGVEQNKAIVEYLKFQDGHKVESKSWLKSFYNVQQSGIIDGVPEEVQAFLENYPNSFLLAPNVIGDSSTLNRELIFGSMRGWMAEVVEFFKTHPQYSLIIRAHPAEVWAKSKVNIKLGDWAETLSKGCKNILVIKGENKMNTFFLLPKIKCGLVWLSSIGVDLVARGIPVICAAQPKYSGLGFVHEPASRKEYFELIRTYGDRHKITTTETERLNAKKYLYVVFKGFSFPAQGRDYSARTLRLNKMPHQQEHDHFFKILAGETDRPDA